MNTRKKGTLRCRLIYRRDDAITAFDTVRAISRRRSCTAWHV